MRNSFLQHCLRCPTWKQAICHAAAKGVDSCAAVQCWLEWREFAWDSKARRVAFTMFSSCTLRKALNQWVAWTLRKQQSAIKARTAVQVRSAYAAWAGLALQATRLLVPTPCLASRRCTAVLVVPCHTSWLCRPAGCSLPALQCYGGTLRYQLAL